MLELYTHPMSPCSQKVRIVLAEKSLDWEKRHVNLAEKENLSPEYLRLNPLGVVPTLVDGGIRSSNHPLSVSTWKTNFPGRDCGQIIPTTGHRCVSG